MLQQARALSRASRFEVPPSHRPLVGGAVTLAKRTLLRALLPWHRAMLAPQIRFNEAAVEAVTRALAGQPLPGELEALAELPEALPILSRQRAFNKALVSALRAAGSALPLASDRPLAPGPLFELLRTQATFNRSMAGLARALLGLHRTLVFEYQGYRIPLHLLELTGARADTWESIARAHLGAYERHTPIAADHAVLEVGCGIGRDAMHLTLTDGSYVGVDVTAPSIEWCRRFITPRHANFNFFHLDVKTDLYNPSGALKPEQVALPVADQSVDRIILQSVFTHLFPPAVARYSSEFRRVLKAGGLVYASLFQLDEASLALARRSRAKLSFRHAHGAGCFVDSALAPEEAVGFTPEGFSKLVDAAGLRIVKIVPGSWPGREADGYQDAAILT